MTRDADPVGVIEAGYAPAPDEGAWLERVMDASEAYDVGGGVLTCTVDLSSVPRVRTLRASPSAVDTSRRVVSFVESLAPSLAAELLAPTEFVGNASWRLNRLLAKREGQTAAAAAGSPLPPLWAFLAGDGRDALVVAFPAATGDFAPDHPFPHRDGRILGLVGAHLGAALRLRRAATLAAASSAVTEAVLSPDGRVLDARGRGEAVETRRSLTEAVLRSERARGTLRRTDDEEATKLWAALVAGRWSIVESVESDGKRLLLARANPPSSPDVTALTREESEVVWLVALGHSYKYVGYQLGLSVSAVVRRLKSAMPKVGVSTRIELVRRLAR